MAEHVAPEVAAGSGPDYEEHVRTYEGFIHLTKWGTIGIIIVLILMAIFLL